MMTGFKGTGAQAKTQRKSLSQKQELIQARDLAAVSHHSLKLKADSPIDLKVISALLQDALIPASNFHYDTLEKTFTILANRFCWEDSPETLNHQKIYGRILCGLYIQNVEKVEHIDLDRTKTDRDYNLLAIDFDTGEGIHFIFSGTTRLKLRVSDLSCHLTDLEDMWYTPSHPFHKGSVHQRNSNQKKIA